MTIQRLSARVGAIAESATKAVTNKAGLHRKAQGRGSGPGVGPKPGGPKNKQIGPLSRGNRTRPLLARGNRTHHHAERLADRTQSPARRGREAQGSKEVNS